MNPETDINLQRDHQAQVGTVKVLGELFKRHKEPGGLPSQGIVYEGVAKAKPVVVYDALRRRRGTVSSARLLPATAVNKSKSDPQVACYNASGELIGVCDPDDLKSLAVGSPAETASSANQAVANLSPKLTERIGTKPVTPVVAKAARAQRPVTERIPAAWEVDAERRIQARLGAVKKGLRQPMLTLGERNLLRRWLASGMSFSPVMKHTYQSWLDGK
jgi:hypothetical protein